MWPGQKCQRCAKLGLDCSANIEKKAGGRKSAVTGSEEVMSNPATNGDQYPPPPLPEPVPQHHPRRQFFMTKRPSSALPVEPEPEAYLPTEYRHRGAVPSHLEVGPSTAGLYPNLWDPYIPVERGRSRSLFLESLDMLMGLSTSTWAAASK